MSRIVSALCGALLGALSWGCTDTKEPVGQLMLAFDSDMAIPKDVNMARLRGDVGSYNRSTDFYIGPGQNRLPATFGVLSEEGAPTAVKFTLGAGRDYPARTIGVAETTIPTNRVALLRLPIQWLCTLRGHGEDPDENDNYTVFVSDCAEDETCNAGRCEKAQIPEEELPDYRPEDVFGGGLGDDVSGTCFDAQEAFGKPRGVNVDSQIDLETCRVPLLGDASNVNFALRVSDGDGVCVAADLCLITLNLSERTGWFETDADGVAIADGGFAQLPTIICDELQREAGRVLDVYQTIGTPAKIPAIPVCGPYSVPSCPFDERPCEAADGPDDPSCLEAGFDNDIDGESVVEDPALATFINLSHDLEKRTDDLQAELGKACVAIAEILDEADVMVDDTWKDLGYTEGHPTLESVGAACASAAASGLSALVDVVRLKLGVMPAQCTVDTAEQTECEESCAPGHGCDDDDRCAEESVISPECTGSCAEGSTCRGGEGARTRCTGLCEGRCIGSCDGLCTRTTQQAGCDGFCSGTCSGFCEGDCVLDVPLVCGTSPAGTCVGECSRTAEEQSCAEPLGGCEEIANDCVSMCKSRIAASSDCPVPGTFVGGTPWLVQNRDLENTLANDVLPELARIEEVMNETILTLEAAEPLDFDQIFSDATELGERELECANRSLDDDSGRGVLPALDRLFTLTEYAALLVERGNTQTLLGYEPPALPPVCVALRENAEALDQECFVCVADNCCAEYQGCTEEEDCIDATGTMGEAPCMIRCVLDNSDAGEPLDDAVVRECVDQCETNNGEGVSSATATLLACVSLNSGGSCENECYATAAEEEAP
jgi:hypothetical protein